jgi:hypothetical protein
MTLHCDTSSGISSYRCLQPCNATFQSRHGSCSCAMCCQGPTKRDTSSYVSYYNLSLSLSSSSSPWTVPTSFAYSSFVDEIHSFTPPFNITLYIIFLKSIASDAVCKPFSGPGASTLCCCTASSRRTSWFGQWCTGVHSRSNCA